ESEEECGRGKRKRKPLRITSSDEEPEEREIIKKKDSTAIQECTKCCVLKEKIKQLEEDNRRLVLRLDTMNELKSMVCELKEGLVERNNPSTSQVWHIKMLIRQHDYCTGVP
uniref:Si:ch73-167f10.1 n=1 Tax=Sinocyclocheilus rhinocerous TaxID=307959 RepID=A0A673KBB2_9TELE